MTRLKVIARALVLGADKHKSLFFFLQTTRGKLQFWQWKLTATIELKL